jgi:hypothetical protein
MGAVGLSPLILTGCTSALLKDSWKKFTYTEDVSSILISQDGTKLIIICPEYHYVFRMPRNLVEIIRSPVHKYIEAVLPPLIAGDGGPENIRGSFYLVLAKNAPGEIVEQAVSLGFRNGGWRDTMAYSGSLDGKRYISRSVLPMGTTQSLNRAYQIEIETYTRGDDKAKLALTPITLAADGVLFIGVLPLLIVTGLILGEKDFR